MTEEIFCYPTRVGPMVHYGFDKVIGRSLRLYGEWAPGEIALLGQLLSVGAVVLDVGANVGYHTLFACQRVGEAGQVWAFEPDPKNRALLELNLLLSAHRNCQVHPFLIGSESKLLKSWSLEFEPLNRGSLKFNTKPEAVRLLAETSRAPLTQVAIDDLGLTRCDLIKIDVEGAEYDVLLGARSTLQTLKPLVFQEQRDSENFSEIASSFRDLDYVGYWSVTKCYPTQNFNGEQHNFFKGATEVNLLWVPKQSQARLGSVLRHLVEVSGPRFDPPSLSQVEDRFFLPAERPCAQVLERVNRMNEVLQQGRTPG